MDVRRSQPRQDAESGNRPQQLNYWFALSGKRFLWFVSLTLIKEMNPPKAERF